MSVPVPFPTYEVPALVLERYPEFRPEDPSTWPEPDRCTEGRPWGHDSYAPGGVLGSDLAYRWQQYLAGGVSSRPCRNRWRSEEYRLCGTHLAPFVRSLIDAGRRDRARQREEQHLDLAKRLAAHGIEAEGRATGVVLQAPAVETLLQRLALLAGAIPPGVWPSTDLSVPPPL